MHDKDRPLKERGVMDGHLVADAFKNLNLEVDAVYSSPANRALHTCMIFLRKMDFGFSSFEVTNQLYDFSGEGVFQFVQGLDNGLHTVMIFGHNYAFTNMVNQCGNSPIDNVPTSGLVQLNFNVDEWSSVSKGITKQILFPKQLR